MLHTFPQLGYVGYGRSYRKGTSASSCARRPPLRLAQGSEARANLFCKELRLFPGRKVPAFVEFVVIDEFGIRALGPTARGLIELVRKGAHGHRDRDPFGGEKGQLAFPIQTSRGDRRLRHPVERDVVQDVVSRQALSLTV